MGANQSLDTRSVSIDNPTPAGIIDVSDEVVQRLKLGIKANAAKTKQQADSKPEPPRAVPVAESKPAPASAPQVKQQPAPLPKTYYVNPSPPPPQQQISKSPIQRFAGEPTITAIEMRRQNEIELQQNDAIWRARMSQMEQTLNKTNAVMEKEYSAAIDDVRKRFMNASPAHQLPPCQDLKAQLIACYRSHPGEALKCSEEVAQFRNCVGVHRIKRLDSEGTPAKGA